MRLTASPRFARRARKLKDPHGALLRAALQRFVADPRDPILRTHKLKGKLAGYWAFSVAGNVRVVFRWEGDEAILVDLGSHDDVYA
jgi:mRNA-degrading endonuclease YafQ of YafQ-DinJ toxin-antitoxin module